MSNFRDLIARMAIDAEFARHARANPESVARQYHLSPDESEQLRGLADAAASAGPVALGARLSKMGGVTSAVLSTPLFGPMDTDGDGIPNLFDTDDDNDGIPDATDSQPLTPNLLIAQPVNPIGPAGPIVTLDPDVINPGGDADGDKIPNILDKNDASADTKAEPWADNDKDGTPNIHDDDEYGVQKYNRGAYIVSGDNDGDGIKDIVDIKPNDPNTANEPLGDKDGDGIKNYVDKFNFPLGDIIVSPDLPVLDPSGGGGTPPTGDPTPPTGDPAPPSGGGDGGGTGPSAPDIVVNVDAPQGDAAQAGAAQQPILLADDAIAKPTVVPAQDGGIGTEVLIVGGVALAAGAVAGGVAGKVFGDKTNEQE